MHHHALNACVPLDLCGEMCCNSLEVNGGECVLQLELNGGDVKCLGTSMWGVHMCFVGVRKPHTRAHTRAGHVHIAGHAPLFGVVPCIVNTGWQREMRT